VSVSDQDHAALYARLRTSLLERHVALGLHDRADLLVEANHLSTRDEKEFSDLLADEQRVTRWRRAREAGENPLMLGGQLMCALAIEHALGVPDAFPPLKAMVTALDGHYRFSGEHFDGCPVRWDAPTSRQWDEDTRDGRLTSREFLLELDGSYAYSPSSDDPRWAPWRPQRHWRNLLPAREQEWAAFCHDEFVDWYRRMEPSMDELCGLVMAYAVIGRLCTDAQIRASAARQATMLSDYLAEHAYILLRPGGGFTARGASGILPALEWPFSRGLGALTGVIEPGRSSFKAVLKKAGVWDALAEEFTLAEIAGVAANLIPPLNALLALHGLAWLTKGSAPPTVNLARAAVVLANSACFDVSNGEAAAEFALATVLLDVGARSRFRLWVRGAAIRKGGWAGDFPPYLGLTALYDDDPAVKNGYLHWFGKRMDDTAEAADGETPKVPAGQTCFAAGVATVLGGGPEAQRRLVARLDAAYAALAGSDPSTADLPVGTDKDDNPNVEGTAAALDYILALALAWLHRGRHPSTVGIPAKPAGFRPPEPAVPKDIVELAQAKDNTGVVLPVNAIDGTPAPFIGPQGAPLFRRAVARSHQRGFVPAVDQTVLYDEELVVSGDQDELLTFIVLQNGNELAIDARGKIAGRGPAGRRSLTANVGYPLHTLVDPRHAHPDALIGRLNGYFYIGGAYPRSRWLFPNERVLYLRRNHRGRSDGGAGEFRVRVRVWGEPNPVKTLLFVTCICRDSTDPGRRIDALGGVHRNGDAWLHKIDTVLNNLTNHIRYFVMSGPTSGNEVIAGCRKGTPYVRTRRDDSKANNLSSLPSCVRCDDAE
jgi:hypothetical protein